MHRTHNKEVTLRKKEEIENFKEKCDLLEKSGWEAKFHIDNWAKKGHQDSNGYWVSYPEYSIDEAYEKVKSSYTLSLDEKNLVISLLEKELYSGDYDILRDTIHYEAFESERNLLKKLKTT